MGDPDAADENFQQVLETHSNLEEHLPDEDLLRKLIQNDDDHLDESE